MPRKPARAKTATTARRPVVQGIPLLAVPLAVLQQLLVLLDEDDLLELMSTSRFMAQQVLQHKAGKFSLMLHLSQDVHWGAIRQILQWAPPASVKLMLNGSKNTSMPSYNQTSDWAELKDVFADPPTEDTPLFPCILELSLQELTLPSLVPADLAAACPNLRLLHVRGCVIGDGHDDDSSKQGEASASSSSKASSSSRGSSSSASTASGRTASSLKKLVIDYVKTPTGKAKRTTSTAPAVNPAEQFRSRVPNLTCVHLLASNPCVDFIVQLLGPQLKELYGVKVKDLSFLDSSSTGAQLQQLQKLVLPLADITSAAGMELLLSLPNLTQVELNSISSLPQDFSSHDCRWQNLKFDLQFDLALLPQALVQQAVPEFMQAAMEHNMLMRMLHMLGDKLPKQQLCLSDLAKLPLHSLTHPLTLGRCGEDYIELELPTSSTPQTLAALERLSQQLMRCGVKVVPGLLSWVAPSSEGSDDLQPGAQLSPAFKTIAPAFGMQSRVQLAHMVVDKDILTAVGEVCQGSLKTLMLRNYECEADMQAAWHAALSGLPALNKVELDTHWKDGDAGDARCIRSLAAAIAQQPAGRCITVDKKYELKDIMSEEEWIEMVMSGAKRELAGVELTAGRGGWQINSIVIKSKGTRRSQRGRA